MAEGLFRLAAASHPEWEVHSAGIAAGNGQPASRETLNVLSRLGIDMSAHQSRHLDGKLMEQATDIFVMTFSHLNVMIANFPQHAQKVRLVTEYTGGDDIIDPFGCSQDAYDATAEELTPAIEAIIRHWEK